MLSNYPPGVTGNEPEIAGEPEEVNDNFNEDEDLMYLVCMDCGEAFEGTNEGIMFAQAHEPNCGGVCSYEIRPENEAH